MLNLKLTVGGLGELDDKISALQGGAKLKADVLNEGINYARSLGADEIMKQVEFPAGYLDRPERFFISTRAKPSQPLAVLASRRRPTSLATFVTGSGPDGVTVRVKKRKGAKKMRRAFLTRSLKAGKARGGNRGLAVRTKGEKPDKSYKPIKMFSDDYGTVWLLYGPSVNQVFNDVADDIIPKVNAFVQRRALQLLEQRAGA